jgi:hypothetical protein
VHGMDSRVARRNAASCRREAWVMGRATRSHQLRSVVARVTMEGSQGTRRLRRAMFRRMQGTPCTQGNLGR